MNFYTRDGDDGNTGILGKGRYLKTDIRFEALGTIDEASAVLGLARSSTESQVHHDIVLKVQRDLYALMGEIAASSDNWGKFHQITEANVLWIEAQIDALSNTVSVGHEFILPGDCKAGAFFSQARAVIRRGERRVIQYLSESAVDNPCLVQYLNRLSSLCFILELAENKSSGKETPTLAKG